MAQRFIGPDGNEVTLDWATEEVMQEILKELKKQKTGSGTSPEDKKKRDETKKTTEGLKDLGNAAGKTDGKLKKLNDQAGKAAESFDKVESSASSVTGSLGSMAGAVGGIAAVIGFAASTFDSFIDVQVSAIQAGFSFSDQLIETRDRLASIGLGFTQLSAIIADQGEAVRGLGDNGAEAAENFTDLVLNLRETTREMGYFGVSSEEMAGELADLVGRMVQSGMTQADISDSAAQAMAALNQETLGLSRLTGIQRRELLRNTALLSGDALIQSLLGDVGGDAVISMDALAANLTAAFGDSSSEFIELFRGLFVTTQEGISALSAEQLGFLGTSGLRPFMDELVRIFDESGDDIGEFRPRIQDFTGRLTQFMQENESEIRRQSVAFTATGNPMGPLFTALLEATTQSRLLADATPTERMEAFNAGLDSTTEVLLQFKNDMDVLINEIRSGILQVFGVDDFSALGDLNLASLIENINSITDSLINVRNWALDFVPEDFFSEGGGFSTAMIAGIAALFLLPSVVSGTIAAIGGLFTGLVTSGVLTRLVGGAISLLWSAGGSVAGSLISGIGALFRAGGSLAAGIASSITSMFVNVGRSLVSAMTSQAFVSTLFRTGPLGAALATVGLLGVATNEYQQMLEEHPEMQGMNNGAGPGLVRGRYLLEQGLLDEAIEYERSQGTYRPPMDLQTTREPPPNLYNGQGLGLPDGTMIPMTPGGQPDTEALQQYLEQLGAGTTVTPPAPELASPPIARLGTNPGALDLSGVPDEALDEALRILIGETQETNRLMRRLSTDLGNQ